MEVVASLSEGRTAAAQCGLFTHKSVPVIFEPPFICLICFYSPFIWCARKIVYAVSIDAKMCVECSI